jgi:cysteine desulfurase/selenocysteine lyase
LYGRREILEAMEPFEGGGEMIREVSFSHSTRRCSISWNALPWKFEAGTPNAEGAVGLLEAIAYLKKVGMENVREHEHALTRHAMKNIQQLEKVEVYGPKDMSIKCGIVPFGVRGLSSHDVALFLDSFGIMVRSGFHCAQPLHETFKSQSSARASFYLYNTSEEIDRFTEALREIE